ncbi:hypothetical protein [Granulicoccus sp. GXG6511]
MSQGRTNGGLQNRHIQLIAIGGTGLFMGSGGWLNWIARGMADMMAVAG